MLLRNKHYSVLICCNLVYYVILSLAVTKILKHFHLAFNSFSGNCTDMRKCSFALYSSKLLNSRDAVSIIANVYDIFILFTNMGAWCLRFFVTDCSVVISEANLAIQLC